MAPDTEPEDASFYAALERLLEDAKNEKELLYAIVNAPFHSPVHATSFDLGIIVLLLVNKSAGTIDHIALSDTEQAKGAARMSEKPFKSIKIPIGHEGNIIAQAIEAGKPYHTGDWRYLFTPALSAQAARFNQAGAGIECSYAYPLSGVRDGGALIYCYYQPGNNIGPRHQQFMQRYSQLIADRFKQV